jgi:sterol desaturase/sphingolipid hydroxylase (fatty acid hydroxylase superfamily)
MIKSMIAFLILFLVFGTIERCFPLRKEQKWLRQNWLTDVAHFFINQVLVKVGTYIVAVLLYILLYGLINPSLQSAVLSQPEWLQFLEAIFLAQLIFYAIHRLSHQIPSLWKFHAIHHSSTELDWLASARLHPIEMITVNIVVGMPLFLLGFTKETFGFYLVFEVFLSILNHANTSLNFPILRWIIATPEFHHWHHSNDLEARDKNFSGFPLIDRLFGTFYLPQNKRPITYGVDQYIPHHYWQQLLYPFQKATK